ncbi:MAG: peptidoglycan DD-metalloendopeptidase family protein [Thermodesulfobacteriota bacterium]
MRFNRSTVFFVLGLCTGIIISSISAKTNLPDKTAFERQSIRDVQSGHQPENRRTADNGNSTVDGQPSDILAKNGVPGFSRQIAHKITGELRPGDTLSDSLSRHSEIPSRVKWQIIDKLSSCLDLRHLKPVDCYTVFLDEDNQLLGCEYKAGPLESYSIIEKDGELTAKQDPVSLEVKTQYINGKIKTSLFKAFSRLGERPSLVYTFADIFASKIDFNREPRPGDRFEALCEKYYKNSEFIGYGNILYVSYIPEKGKSYRGFFYHSRDKSGAYYDQDGKELGTFFLKSPLPVFRLTSEFSWKRKHPILKVVRPHLGVDLAAPIGTPVRAVADGKVTFKGKNGGYGNQVILSHKNNYKTYYGHLSRFSRNLSTGERVKQKQIIGYVGSTGLSTGPHLDYRLKKADRFLDPFATKFKPRSILKSSELARFKESMKDINTMLAQQDGKEILLVRQMVLKPGDSINFF